MDLTFGDLKHPFEHERRARTSVATRRFRDVSIKVDPADAERIMRAAGCIPLVAYPGSAALWSCIHESCGRTITPTYGNVRQGKGVCKACSVMERGAKRRAGLAEAAVLQMRAAGFEPLEPYPGTDKPWRSRHVVCGEERTPSVNTVRSRGTACRDCSARAAGRAVWTPESAEATFRARGLEPLEPWPGSSSKPWQARHVACGRIVKPRLGNVAAGQGPCRECGQEATHDALRKSEDEAVVLFRTAGLEPLEPYPGVDSPWRSRHKRCGGEVAPSYTNLKRGQGGCLTCAKRDLADQLRMPEADARAIMLNQGLDPIEPYPGSGRPWASRHSCGKLVSPTLSNVSAGNGICRYCNSSFPFDGPAVLYLVVDRNAMKIGCASPDGKRLAAHLRYGWAVAWTIDVGSGDDAANLERAILTWWRKELSLAPAYRPEDLPQTGYSETALWDAVNPADVLMKVRELAAEAQISLLGVTETLFTSERPRSVAGAVGARARAKQAELTGQLALDLNE